MQLRMQLRSLTTGTQRKGRGSPRQLTSSVPCATSGSRTGRRLREIHLTGLSKLRKRPFLGDSRAQAQASFKQAAAEEVFFQVFGTPSWQGKISSAKWQKLHTPATVRPAPRSSPPRRRSRPRSRSSFRRSPRADKRGRVRREPSTSRCSPLPRSTSRHSPLPRSRCVTADVSRPADRPSSHQRQRTCRVIVHFDDM